MRNFSRRALGYITRNLNKVNDNLNRQDAEKKAVEEEMNWTSKFTSEGYFDFNLGEKVTIRLYQDSVLSRLIFDGFENSELEFLKRFLRKGDTFFDIGANVGLFSLIASEKIESDGRIIAFEPSPKTYARLQENININSLSNVKLYNIGLSDKIGSLKLNVSENGYDAWNTFASGEGEDDKFQTAVEVEINTLDNIIIENNIENINLIKLDVEGWEKFVLYGGEYFIKNSSPVIMVEFTESNTFAAGYHVQEIYDILESWGYKWYRYIDGKMIYEAKKLHYPYDNLFATKNIDIINNRINY